MKTTRDLLLILIAAVLAAAPRSLAQFGPGVGTGPGTFSIDVSKYGAVPDDGVDDTAAIQAALYECSLSTAGQVTVTKPGRYEVTNLYTSAGSSPTAPNSTLNAALVIYSNTKLVSSPGVEFHLGITQNAARCYILRNADPTAGNSNVTIDGGFWNGGGIVAEATYVSDTSVTIPGDYAARLAGQTFYLSAVSGKTAFTCTTATYNSGTGLTTVNEAAGAPVCYSGGLQSSWQLSNVRAPALVTCSNAANTITVAGDYRAYASDGSTVFLYNNGAGTATWNRAFTVSGTPSFGGGNTTVTTVEDLAGATEGASGSLAFVHTTTWYADLIRLQNVTDLAVRNTKGGGVDKYVWHVVGCTRATFQSNVFNNGSDGIHLGGGNTNVSIRDTRGRTLDNLIACVQDEKWYRSAQTDISGNNKNILVEGVFLDSGVTTFEPFRSTGTSAYSLEGLTLRSFYGTVGAGYGIRIADDTAAGYGNLTGCVHKGIVIEDIHLAAPSGYAVVTVSGSGTKDVTIRGLEVKIAANTGVLIAEASASFPLTLDALTISDLTTATPCTGKLVQIDSIVKRLNVTGVNASIGSGGVAIQVSAAPGLIVDGNVSSSSVEAENSSGTAVFASFLNTASLSRINFSGVNFRKTAGGTAYPLNVTGRAHVDFSGCSFVNTSGATSTMFCNINSGGKVRVTGGSCRIDLDGDGEYTDNGLTFFGTQNASTYVSVDNPAWAVGLTSSGANGHRVLFKTGDASFSPRDGDRFYNSDAFAYVGTTYTRGYTNGAPGTTFSDATNSPFVAADADTNTPIAITAISGTSTTAATVNITARTDASNVTIASNAFGNSAGNPPPPSDASHGDITYAIRRHEGSPGPGLMVFNGTASLWEAVTPGIRNTDAAGTYFLGKQHGGMTFSNAAAAGTITWVLPPAVVGVKPFRFMRAVAQTVRIEPANQEQIALPSTGVAGAASKYLSMDTTGAYVELACRATGVWSVTGYSGTFTAEP